MVVHYIYDLYDKQDKTESKPRNNVLNEKSNKTTDHKLSGKNNKETKEEEQPKLLGEEIVIQENTNLVPSVVLKPAKQVIVNKPEQDKKSPEVNDNWAPVLQLKVFSTPHNPTKPWDFIQPNELLSSCFITKIKFPEGFRFFATSNAHCVNSCIVNDKGELITNCITSDERNFEGRVCCVCPSYDLSLIEMLDLEDDLKKRAIEIKELEDFDIQKMKFLPRKTDICLKGFANGDPVASEFEGKVNGLMSKPYLYAGGRLGFVYNMDVTAREGDSGGSIYKKGTKELVGIMFEGKQTGENYAIPVQVLNAMVSRYKRKLSLLSKEGTKASKQLIILEPFVHNLELQTLVSDGNRKHYDLDNVLVKEKIGNGVHDRLGVRVKGMPTVLKNQTQLKVEDVLLSVNGMNIHSDMNFTLNGEAQQLDTLSMFITEDNRDVVFKVLRKNSENPKGYQILDLTHKYDIPQNLVSASPYTENYEYVVAGGGIFVNLTQKLIEACMANGFGNSVSIEELSLVLNGDKKVPNQHVVVLSGFVPTVLNSDLVGISNVIVSKINDVEINSLLDVVKASNMSKNNMSIKTSDNTLISLSFPDGYEKDNSVILLKNQIPDNGIRLKALEKVKCDCTGPKNVCFDSKENKIVCKSCKKDLINVSNQNKENEVEKKVGDGFGELNVMKTSDLYCIE